MLIATPEYNGAAPGVLKNALDWLSRPLPHGPAVLERKPVAIIGTSQGPLGTIRAQLGLRLVLHRMNAAVLGQPEFVLPHARQHFTTDGMTEDIPTQTILCKVMEGLEDLVRHQRQIVSAR